jgi:signal transduction histidine kinase
VKEYLQIIDAEVRTSEKIITDLLDFSRIKSLDQTLTDINTLVEQTLERNPAPPEVSVRRHIASGLPQVFADAQQMVQVLGNLLTNAYQAMDNRGKMTISARQDGNMVAISVKDSGPGISPENMQKLFEPLFTTKLRGIGLGLAVSRRFVEANGGRLEVHSETGKGSTFIVYLPIQEKVADE